MKEPLSIFAIIKTDSGEAKLKTLFIEKDYTSAKLWLQGYLIGEKNPIKYSLMKIGTINDKLDIEKTKIFICNGSNVIKSENEKKYEQYKLFTERQKEKEKLENLKKIYKYGVTDMTEVIKLTFEGKEIYE